MAHRQSIREIEITSGGGSISLDPEEPVDEYQIITSGSVTLTSSWTIDALSHNLKNGTKFLFRYKGDVDLSGNSITIFGHSIDGTLANKNFTFIAEYDGSSFITQLQPDFEESDFIRGQHIGTDQVAKENIDYSDALGEGLEEASGKAAVNLDTGSIERSSSGIKLTNDSGSPSDLTYYGVNSSSTKGFHSFQEALSQYDSGWKRFPYYGNNSTGFLNISNHLHPQFRVIGRTVYLGGMLLIPLDDSGLVGDLDNYISTQSVDVHTSSSGISISTGINGVGETLNFPVLLDDSELFPEKNTRFEGHIMTRRIHEKNSTATISLSTFVTKVKFTASGTLELSSISNHEIPGSGGDSNTHIQTSQLRHLVTVANDGDDNLDWSGYRSSYNGSLLNTQAQGSYTYGVDINGNDCLDWGGFTMWLNPFYWTLDSSISLDTIKSKFSNYTDV